MNRFTMEAIGILLSVIACQVHISGADDGWVSCSGAEKEMTFLTAPRTWLAAEQHCQQSGGHLATMRAQPDFACATTAVAEQSSCVGANCNLVWTGLNRLNSVASFHWTGDFNAVESSTNNNILSGGAGIADYQCVAWLPTLGLYNRQCGNSRKYLCERRLSATVVRVSCQGKGYTYHTIAESYRAAVAACQASGQVLVAATDPMQCVNQLFLDPRLQAAQALAFWSTCTTPGGNSTQCSTVLDTSGVVWTVQLQTTINPHPRPFICRDPDTTTPPTSVASSMATVYQPTSTTAPSSTVGPTTTTSSAAAAATTLPPSTTTDLVTSQVATATTNRKAPPATTPQVTSGLPTASTGSTATPDILSSTSHPATVPSSRPSLNPDPEATATPHTTSAAAPTQNPGPNASGDGTPSSGPVVIETRIVDGSDESEAGAPLGLLAGAVVGGAVMFSAIIMIACFVRSRYRCGDSRNRLDTAASIESNHGERPDPCIWVAPSKKRDKVKNPAESHQYENAELRKGGKQPLGPDDIVQYAALQLKRPSAKGRKQVVHGKKEPPTQYAALEHSLNDVVEMCRSASR